MIREFNQKWKQDYVRKTAETLYGRDTRLLDITMIDLMWDKQNFKSSWKRSTKRAHTHTHTHTHTTYSLTDARIHVHFTLCLTHQYIRSAGTLAAPHTLP